MSTKTTKSNKSSVRDKEKHSAKSHHGAAKGGAGGKGTWGAEGDEYADSVDVNDPNYEDPADQEAVDAQERPLEEEEEEEDEDQHGSGRRRRRRREPAEAADPTWVFAGNLSLEVTDDDLHDLFSQYGTIEEATVSKRRSKRSVVWGKVNFSTEEEAQAALAAHGTLLHDLPVTVEIMRNAPRKKMPREPLDDDEPVIPPNDCQLFIGNLAWSVTTEELTEHFSVFGPLVSAEVATHPKKSRSRGWATVEYENREDAITATEKMMDFELEGRPLTVEPLRNGPTKRKRKKKPRTKKPRAEARAPLVEEEPELNECVLFVGNLNWELREEEVETLFADVGTVVNVEIAKDKRTGRSRGWATVEMATIEEAATAIETLDGQEFSEREIAVQIRKGTSRRRTRRRQRTVEGDDDDDAPTSGSGRRRPRKPRSKPETRYVENPDCHLFVGNVAFSVTEDELNTYFAEFGTVANLEIARDRRSQNSRGWATVEMASPEEAQAAIDGAHDKEYQERPLVVRLDSQVSSAGAAETEDVEEAEEVEEEAEAEVEEEAEE